MQDVRISHLINIRPLRANSYQYPTLKENQRSEKYKGGMAYKRHSVQDKHSGAEEEKKKKKEKEKKKRKVKNAAFSNTTKEPSVKPASTFQQFDAEN